MDLEPIFVHSLFRAGSTYIFGAFRRSPAGYWCYQEPLHEYLRHAATAPERLLDIDFAVGAALRHPRLDKPYFWEFHEIKSTVASLFRKELSYDWFFAAEGQPSFELTATYLQALLDEARGRPMLQCCRTFGRAAALKQRLGGLHAHLWRNPWDQWWSYQVDNYFEATDQLIFNAVELPPVLRAVRKRCAISDFHEADVETEVAHASDHRLNARSAYLAFYALWLYAFVELEAVADLSINIDLLSASAAYRRRTLDSLRAAGITNIDFSDCRIAQAGFGARDRAFFEDVEDDVHRLFEQHGYPATTLDPTLRLRAACRPAQRRAGQRLIDDAERAREAARQQIDRTVATQHDREAQAAALGRARAFAETLERDFARTRADLGRRDAEVSALTSRAAQLAQQIEAQAGKLLDSQHELDARSERLVEAQRELDARAATIDRAQAAAAAIAAELAQRRLEISELKNDVAAVRLQLGAAGTLAIAREKENHDLAAQLASRDGELAQAGTYAQLQYQALLSTREYAGNLESELAAARSRVDELHREMTRWCGVANDINRHLQAVYATRSWRLTAPLRWAKANARVSRLAAASGWGGLAAAIKRAVARLLAKAVCYLQTRPVLKLAIVRLLARFPDPYHRLRALVFRHGAAPVPVAAAAAGGTGLPQPADLVRIADPEGLDHSSPAVRRTYHLLVAAREVSALEIASSRATPSD